MLQTVSVEMATMKMKTKKGNIGNDEVKERKSVMCEYVVFVGNIPTQFLYASNVLPFSCWHLHFTLCHNWVLVKPEVTTAALLVSKLGNNCFHDIVSATMFPR